MLRIPPIPLIRRGDYSYGIYLYGFPICQAFVAGMPRLIGHPYWLILIAGATTVALAVVSWHFIEHPFSHLNESSSSAYLSARMNAPEQSRDPERRAHDRRSAASRCRICICDLSILLILPILPAIVPFAHDGNTAEVREAGQANVGVAITKGRVGYA
jgi:hypothetical protein